MKLSPKVLRMLRADFFSNRPDATEADWRRVRRLLNSPEGRAVHDMLAAYRARTGASAEHLFDAVQGKPEGKWALRLVQKFLRENPWMTSAGEEEWERAMWRMSNAEALPFITAVSAIVVLLIVLT
jgi:hypothetical protein